MGYEAVKTVVLYASSSNCLSDVYSNNRGSFIFINVSPVNSTVRGSYNQHRDFLFYTEVPLDDLYLVCEVVRQADNLEKYISRRV